MSELLQEFVALAGVASVAVLAGVRWRNKRRAGKVGWWSKAYSE